jgi:hypothetical protein
MLCSCSSIAVSVTCKDLLTPALCGRPVYHPRADMGAPKVTTQIHFQQSYPQLDEYNSTQHKKSYFASSTSSTKLLATHKTIPSSIPYGCCGSAYVLMLKKHVVLLVKTLPTLVDNTILVYLA